MALPTGPVPRVALDEIIEESWGDSVAQSLNNSGEQHSKLMWSALPSEILAPTTYSSSGDLPDVWFTVGGTGGPTITVPDWADRALAVVNINGISLGAAGYSTYDLQAQIGDNAGRRIRRTARQVRTISTADDREWFGLSWTEDIDLTDPGDRHIRIRAGRRYSGDQRWAVDGSSDIGIYLTFLGEFGFAGFYPGI